MNDIRKTIAFFWVLIPPLLFSALIHTTDPDVNGIQGLASVSTLLSVFVFGLPLVVFPVLSLMIWQRAGRNWAVLAILLFAGFTALFLTTAGSGATTALGLAWSFVGSTILVSLVLGISILPAVIWGGRSPDTFDFTS